MQERECMRSNSDNGASITPSCFRPTHSLLLRLSCESLTIHFNHQCECSTCMYLVETGAVA